VSVLGEGVRLLCRGWASHPFLAPLTADVHPTLSIARNRSGKSGRRAVAVAMESSGRGAARPRSGQRRLGQWPCPYVDVTQRAVDRAGAERAAKIIGYRLAAAAQVIGGADAALRRQGR